MEDFSRLLTIALGLVSLATLIGLSLLRGIVVGLRERLKDADEELTRKGRRLDEAEARVLILENDLAALGRVVTGEAHWVAIGAKLDEHHGEATTHWARDEEILEEIRDRLPPRKPGGS